MELAVESPAAAVASIRDALAFLRSFPLDRLGESEVLDLARDLEAAKRAIPAIEHAVIGQLQVRGTAHTYGCRDVAVLLRDALRITAREAGARVRAADLASTVAVSGATCPPPFPVVAAAQADGAISVEHAQVIRAAVERVPAEFSAEAEAMLTGHAHRFDPAQLRQIAARLLAFVAPENQQPDDEAVQRRRYLSITPAPGGGYDIRGQLTEECGLVVLTACRSQARPDTTPASSDSSGADNPAGADNSAGADSPDLNGERDPRTAGQRLHDALHDLAVRALDTGLSANGGVPATVIITIPLETLEDRIGAATTVHGGVITVEQALRLAARAKVFPTVLDEHSRILALASTRRCATEAQRLALIARDQGCIHPGCTIPATWTQAHHVTPWIDLGPTETDNLALLCGFHHRQIGRNGWSYVVEDGVPYAIAPKWLDPAQTKQRNPIHHP